MPDIKILPELLVSAVEYVPMTDLPFLSRWQPGQALTNVTFADVFNALFILSIVVGASLAVFMFIWGGLQMISARNKSSNITKGKEKMSNAVIGLLMLLSTYVVLNTINPQLTSLNALQNVTPLTAPQANNKIQPKNNTKIPAGINTGDYCYSTYFGFGRECYKTMDECQRNSGGEECYDQNKDIKKDMDPDADPNTIIDKYAQLKENLYCYNGTTACYKNQGKCMRAYAKDKASGDRCLANKQYPKTTSRIDGRFKLYDNMTGKVVEAYDVKELCDAFAFKRNTAGGKRYSCR